MPRPKSSRPRLEHVAVRLDAEIIARLDALLPLYALPGRPATHSDVTRAVILAGLDVEEKRAARLVGGPPTPTSTDGTGA
jgi:hypothetical protein